MGVKAKKKSVSVDEALYTQFDYEKHPSFFEDLKKRVVKKAVKIIDKIKKKQKVYTFAEKRKLVEERSLKKDSLAKRK